MLHNNSAKSSGEEVRSGRRDHYRELVYGVISGSFRTGTTDREVMEKLNEIDPNNIRPEITRLRDDGLVKEIGKTKCRVTGKTVRLVAVTGVPYFKRGAKRFAIPAPVAKPRDLFMSDDAVLQHEFSRK